MKKAAVFGHFAYGLECLDGQTVKTRTITEELQRQLGDNEILKVDTHGGLVALLKSPFQVALMLKKCKNVVIFPAQNGLRVYARLLCFQKKFFKERKLQYVVIGGWLPEFLNDRKRLSKCLKKFDCIYVETEAMKSALETQGFENIFVMPNCKKLPLLSEDELVYSKEIPYKLCTFSRVMREKGIEDAVNAVKNVNNKLGYVAYSLDIYGQVDYLQGDWFDVLKRHFSDNIQYCGCVDSDKSVEALKNYFALLFPTYYEGEGFAGTLIDAFSAAIPIIATNWKYNSEIVSEDVGFLYPAKDIKALENILEVIVDNPKLVFDKKHFCLMRADYYRIENAIKTLINNL